ncbi:hypothetical protein VTK73DRAFT_4411 [Phialemonium thermophilum]|uniref:Secreted protein n=1 Tax=Phialemonium thermophilum TaxID=223376 RepID=A0ABR3V988_9PEZI
MIRKSRTSISRTLILHVAGGSVLVVPGLTTYSRVAESAAAAACDADAAAAASSWAADDDQDLVVAGGVVVQLEPQRRAAAGGGAARREVAGDAHGELDVPPGLGDGQDPVLGLGRVVGGGSGQGEPLAVAVGAGADGGAAREGTDQGADVAVGGHDELVQRHGGAVDQLVQLVLAEGILQAGLDLGLREGLGPLFGVGLRGRRRLPAHTRALVGASQRGRREVFAEQETGDPLSPNGNAEQGCVCVCVPLWPYVASRQRWMLGGLRHTMRA